MDGMSEPMMPMRSTNILSDDHKKILDDMCCDMTVEEMRDTANHINNKADEMEDKMRKTVSYDDFMKVKKEEESEKY